MPKHHKWTIDEENLLHKGVNDGLKPSEIKQKYLPSVELSAIQHQVRKIKASKYKSHPPTSPEYKMAPTTKGNIQ